MSDWGSTSMYWIVLFSRFGALGSKRRWLGSGKWPCASVPMITKTYFGLRLNNFEGLGCSWIIIIIIFSSFLLSFALLKLFSPIDVCDTIQHDWMIRVAEPVYVQGSRRTLRKSPSAPKVSLCLTEDVSGNILSRYAQHLRSRKSPSELKWTLCTWIRLMYFFHFISSLVQLMDG